MKRSITALSGIAAVTLAATLFGTASPAAAASLTQVTNFGTNPSNLKMYIYVPDQVAPKPALLLAVHHCQGSGTSFFNNLRDFRTAADRYGFVMVFPEATRSGACFDVYTNNALKRGAGSDPVGIMSMVSYAQQRYNVDPARIVLYGASSGAMMSTVLAAEYPDVFAAATVSSGVPAGCFATGAVNDSGNTWNGECSGGRVIKTAQQWGDLARSMNPGYTGTYPRMQFLHGDRDTTLAYQNLLESVKQWTNLHALSETPAATDQPQQGWTRKRYGGTDAHATIESIVVAGAGHGLPSMNSYVLTFLGLDQS